VPVVKAKTEDMGAASGLRGLLSRFSAWGGDAMEFDFSSYCILDLGNDVTTAKDGHGPVDRDRYRNGVGHGVNSRAA